jgi:hypothetical protein
MGTEGVEIPITPADALLGILLPGAVALVIFAIGGFRWRKDGFARTAHWTAPLAFTVAFVIGFIDLNGGLPSFPPTESSHRLFFIVPAILLIALILNWRKLTPIVRALIVLVTAAAAFRYVLAFKFNILTPSQAWTWMAVSALATLIWAFALLSYAKSASHIATPLALFILAGAISLVFMLTDSLSNGRCELTFVAATGAAIIAALLFRNFSLASAGGTFSFVLLTTLLIGHTCVTAGLKPLDIALLAIAPIVLWLTTLIPLKARPWRRIVLQLVLLSIPLAVATVRAVIAFNHANQISTQSGGETDL